jgi:hypothetical protein
MTFHEVAQGPEIAMKQIQSSMATAKRAHQVHSPEIQHNDDEVRVVGAMQDASYERRSAVTGRAMSVSRTTCTR